MIKKATYILLLFSVVFLFIPNVYADEDECNPCPKCYSGQCIGSVTGESGYSSCGGVVRERWCDPCCGGCWYSYNRGYPWQKCQSQCHWGWPCEGGCLDIPKDPSYNGKEDNKDVLLPATLSWRNVAGFGWLGTSSPHSYLIEIGETNANPLDVAYNETKSTLEYFTERLTTGQCLRFTPQNEIPSFTYKTSEPSDEKGRREQSTFGAVLKSNSVLNSNCSNLAKYYDDNDSDRVYDTSCNWGSYRSSSKNSFLRIMNEAVPYGAKCLFSLGGSCLAYNNLWYQQSCLYDFVADNCLLRSDDSFEFRIRACCSISGSNCGNWSDWWSFETKDSPEVLKVGTPTENKSFFTLLDSETVVGLVPETVNALKEANPQWCDTRKLQETIGSSRVNYEYYDRYEIDVQQRLPKFTFWQTFQDHPLIKTRNTPIYSISASITDAKPPTNILNEDYLLFTKSDYSSYRWRVRACDRHAPNLVCTNYSDWHYFEVSKDVTVDLPRLTFPGDDPDGEKPISWPVQFQWDSPVGANSYIFELLKDDSVVYSTVVKSAMFDGAVSRTNSVSLSSDKLSLDTLYSWRVKSCWDEIGRPEYCEDEWSERSFKTTGGMPEIVYPLNEEAINPVRFEWKQYPGARAYFFTLAGESRMVTDNTITIGDFEMGEIYTWSISACNSVDDSECGVATEASFKIVDLESPNIISPEIGEIIHSKDARFVDFEWSDVLGVNTYYLEVFCTPEEEGAETKTILEEIIKKTERRLSLSCVGDYSWKVYSCVDPECENVSEATLGSFQYIQDTGGTGFIPCGLNHNNPDTEWDESESCEIKHIFILFKNILDFILWQVIPFLLIMLIIYSGIMFYIAVGSVEVVAKIKSMWVAIRNGLLIIISAWFIVELIMVLMGYSFSVPWWQISF
ncbi:MAG: pilin [Candidatus Pacebacteria bacterium]|nr:pilin [Candidatus Paceibacterota bacterium]